MYFMFINSINTFIISLGQILISDTLDQCVCTF